MRLGAGEVRVLRSAISSGWARRALDDIASSRHEGLADGARRKVASARTSSTGSRVPILSRAARRPGDVPLLVAYLMERHGGDGGVARPTPGLLERYPWPERARARERDPARHRAGGGRRARG
jgi:hypothetical protein